MNLLEAVAVVFMITILTIGGGSWYSDQTAATAAQRVLASEILLARSKATIGTAGVTIALRPSDQAGTPGSVLELYQGRPAVGSTQGALLDRTTTRVQLSISGSTTAGIFIGTDMHVSLSTGWTPWTVFATDPGCPTEVTFTITGLATTAGTQLSCDNAVLS